MDGTGTLSSRGRTVEVDEAARAQRVLTDVAGIATSSASTAERARAIVESLLREFRHEAGVLTLFDPETGRHVPLVNDGYDSRVARHMDGPSFAADIEQVGLHGHVVFRGCDLPVPQETVYVWGEFLYPAGFREGIGVGLFTSDDRYLGMLTLNKTDPRPDSDATRTLFVRLGPLIADAVDPLRNITSMASVVAGAVAGVVVTRAGAILSMPGLPGHPALAAGSAVLTAAIARQVTAPYVTFLSPVPGPTPATGLVRVTGLAVPVQVPSHLVGAVLVSPPPTDLHDLTRRELEVLGALTEGWSNARIAAVLAVTERTVAAHVEHIKLKLAAPSRTVAAVRAARQGIYIPVELSRVGPNPAR
jgi:DNA-binding CsgD family transcriptional regulator